jgi:hypothetical protein
MVNNFYLTLPIKTWCIQMLKLNRSIYLYVIRHNWQIPASLDALSGLPRTSLTASTKRSHDLPSLACREQFLSSVDYHDAKTLERNALDGLFLFT